MFDKIKELVSDINKTYFPKNNQPPYSYIFLRRLKEKEYPKYLKNFFIQNTGQDLNLKNPKTFNEKIQWLKLYDNSDLKTQLTDKVLVRDWVKDKIGEAYLKPVLKICKSFDDINFDELPNSFMIKCNHARNWRYKIINKEKLLENEGLFQFLKHKFDNYLHLSFVPFGGFELQYKNIVPQIIIEPLMIDENNKEYTEYQIYCFNGQPKIYQKIIYTKPVTSCVYNEDFSISEINFDSNYIQKDIPADDNLKLAVELSKKMAEQFKLVRIDWLEYKSKIYFNEMSFTPNAGIYKFPNPEWNIKLGNMLDLENLVK